MERIRLISGSEVESVRMANDRVSMLLRNCEYKVCLEDANGYLLERVATSVMSRVDWSSTVLRFLIQGAQHDTTLIVQSMVVSRNGLLGQELSSDLTMVPPVVS